MNKYLLLITGLLLSSPLILGLSGCGAKAPTVSYYSLLGADLTPVSSGAQSHLAIQVGPVGLPDVLKRSQIVIGRAGEQYQLSENHRWSGEVDDDFARAMGEHLSHGLGTEQVAIYPMGLYLPLTHQVLLDVLALDGVIGQEARLVVRWSVIDPTSKKVQVTRRSLCKETPVDKSYEAWVGAQRNNLRCLGTEIVAALKATQP